MKQAAASVPTRREARRELRRDAILDVAARTFLARGYAGTTMSGIAAELGGSKGTLWNYYPSKEQLFDAVLDRRTSAFRAKLSVILNPDDEAEAAIRRFAVEFIDKVVSPDGIALHRLVVGEAARFPEIGRIFHERAPRLTQLLLADYLAGAMQRGQLRIAEPFPAAQLLTGLCLSGCHQQLLLGVMDAATPGLIAADAERAADIFLRAFGVVA